MMLRYSFAKANLIIGAASLYGAAAQPVGEVISIEGERGSVVVVRANGVVELDAGALLFAGDRVVARASGAARLAASGCSATLEPSSMIVIDSAFCGDESTRLFAAHADAAAEGGAASPDAISPIVAAAGILVASAGALALAGSGEAGAPISP
ncbi:MAG: hypothetical protein AAFX03_03105 [Pseudomonadota bacterium]